MPPVIGEQRQRPQELLQRVGPALYREALKDNISLSVWLERQDPSGDYNDGLDAFGRLLKVAGIRTRSIPEQGIYASTYESFFENDQTRALIPEWTSRIWRERTTGRSASTRALYTSSDTALGSALRPYSDAAGITTAGLASPIALNEIIAVNTEIEGNTYRATYLTDDATQARMVRVSEGAEMPRAKLTSGSHTITAYKYGRVIEAPYEVLRRQTLDMIRLHVRRMAAQAEKDKLATVIDIIVNGDGNSGTAATNYNASSLDSASTGGALTLLAYLAFKMKFGSPYGLSHLIGQESSVLKAMTLNTGSGNIPLVSIQQQAQFGSQSQMTTGLADDVRVGWTSDAPSGVLVGLDNEYAIERVVERGSFIQEVERFITRQTEGLAMSENEGFRIIDAGAIKTLTLS